MTGHADTTEALDTPSSTRAALIEYSLERFAWIVGAVLILLALAGYLGPGPLGARQSSTSDGSLTARYYAVHRYEAPAELAVWFMKPSNTDSLHVAIDRSFTDETTMETITPKPTSTSIRGDKIIYEFRAVDVPAGSFITYRYKYDDFGWLRYTVGLAGQPGVEVAQFVLP